MIHRMRWSISRCYMVNDVPIANDIVFARTRWNYDSYVDYWELVELSGFPIVWLDEMDLYKMGTTYIVSPMNGEFVPYMEQHKGRVSEVLLWNLERPSGNDDGIRGYIIGNRQYMDAKHLDGIIVSDRQLAKDVGFKFVPLGSHSDLGMPGDLNARLRGYDLIHLCCYSNHRSGLFKSPSKPKPSIDGLLVAPNAWGDERHIKLMNSRFMFNVHQDEFPYMEPLRFSLAAAYGLPILSEYCFDVWPYMSHEWVRMDKDYRKLLNSEWVRDLAEFVLRGHPAGLEMREHMTTTQSFRACLESYL